MPLLVDPPDIYIRDIEFSPSLPADSGSDSPPLIQLSLSLSLFLSSKLQSS